MRILIVSDCTKLPGFSTLFIQPWEWARSVRDMFPSAHFDVLLPEKDKIWGDYDSSPYENQERIRIHYVPMISTGGIQQTMIATRQLYALFNVDRTAFYYDAVLNPCAIFSPVLKKVLKPKFVTSAINIPIFHHTGSVRTNITRHQQLNTDYGEEDVIAETVAWLTDFSLFMCGAEKDLALDNCRTYLSGSMIRAFDARSFVLPMGGIDFDELDRHASSLPKKVGEKGICIFFGGRWVEGKGFSKYLGMVERAFRAGDKIYGIATTPAAEEVRAVELRKQYPMIEFYPNCDRATFYEKLKEGHIFLSFSMWEGFGISYWEMLYLGLVGIFLKRPWNESALPLSVYSSGRVRSDQMYSELRGAIHNLSERQYDVSVAREYLRGRYEKSKVNAAIYVWMLCKTGEHYLRQFGPGHSRTFKELAADSLSRLPSPTPIEMLYRMMESCAKSDSMEFGRRNQFVSRMFIRQCAQAAGYRDLCSGAEPQFVKGMAFLDERAQT